LAHGVEQFLQRRARLGNLDRAARSDALALLGDTQQLARTGDHFGGKVALLARLDCEEPGLCHERRHRLRGSRHVRLGRRILVFGCYPAVAHAAPQVYFPRCRNDDAADARAVAADFAAGFCEHVHRRVQLRASRLDVCGGLLDACHGKTQVGVVRDRFGNERRQLRVAERGNPVVLHRPGRG
jgi:hypothetical protein